jgi:hypothetical protein
LTPCGCAAAPQLLQGARIRSNSHVLPSSRSKRSIPNFHVAPPYLPHAAADRNLSDAGPPSEPSSRDQYTSWGLTGSRKRPANSPPYYSDDEPFQPTTGAATTPNAGLAQYFPQQQQHQPRPKYWPAGSHAHSGGVQGSAAYRTPHGGMPPHPRAQATAAAATGSPHHLSHLSYHQKAPSKPLITGGPCENPYCGVVEAPQWRRIEKKLVCNRCGMYYHRHSHFPDWTYFVSRLHARAVHPPCKARRVRAGKCADAAASLRPWEDASLHAACTHGHAHCPCRSSPSRCTACPRTHDA